MRAIFFDLYETLVTHHDPDWRPPPQSIAGRLGIQEAMFRELWQRFDTAWQLGEVASYADALTGVCRAAGVEPDVDVLAQLADEYRAETAQLFERIESEIVEMVAALRDSGWKLGIITNATNLDSEPWFDCCLAPYFDDIVISHQVGLLKSDTPIFELACRRLYVQPDEALFVGDGGGNELRGATEAGLTAYWCTWFLDRWPEGIRPNGFPGDEWRQFSTAEDPPFPRLRRPADLVNAVQESHQPPGR